MTLRILQYWVLVFVLGLFANESLGQTELRLSQKMATGIAELRRDIILRRNSYQNHVKNILVEIDSSHLEDEKKIALIEYIKEDFVAGGRSNNLDLFYQLPKDHPFRSPYLESYIANNEDYTVDQAMIVDFITMGLFGASNALKTRDLQGFLKEFELLNIQKNDKILHLESREGAFAMLMAYVHEGVEITLHNRWQDLHFRALDRMDRYPNVNNGNVIEFLQNENERLQTEGELWDKIIIRDRDLANNKPGALLVSLHDNLFENGYLYVLHAVQSEDIECNSNLTRARVIKIISRSKFELIDEINFGCNIFFKFKSIQGDN